MEAEFLPEGEAGTPWSMFVDKNGDFLVKQCFGYFCALHNCCSSPPLAKKQTKTKHNIDSSSKALCCCCCV
jgi:hypothetical protein